MVFIFYILSLFSNPIPQPTYTCFNDSMVMIKSMARANPHIKENGRVFLVHGLCKDKFHQYGHDYYHSWVEVKSDYNEIICVYSAYVGGKFKYQMLPQEEFYKTFGVVKSAYYLPQSALEFVEQTRSEGPWLTNINHHAFGEIEENFKLLPSPDLEKKKETK